MRRKRRKRSGTWLPMLGTYPESGDDEFASANTYIQLDVPTLGSPIIGVVPLTFDYPQEQPQLSNSADTMAEIVGSEYILSRILGQCLACNRADYNPVVNDPTPEALQLTCGFFVARAGSEETNPLGPNAPLGFGLSGISSREEYDPEHPATVREPWMWKRTWILGNAKRNFNFTENTGQAGPGWGVFPPSTAGYGDIRSGPQVDVKSRRRVGSDDRLWFAASARGLPFGQTFVTPQFIDIALCVRMYGTLVKARNKGSF